MKASVADASEQGIEENQISRTHAMVRRKDNQMVTEYCTLKWNMFTR